MNVTPIRRVHMIDTAKQTDLERSRLAEVRGNLIANILAIVIVASAWIWIVLSLREPLPAPQPQEIGHAQKTDKM